MSDRVKLHVDSAATTQVVAARLGALLEPGDCVELIGELGAGKTTFTKGIGAGRAIPPIEIASPSFTLVHSYCDAQGVVILHVDGFRLRGPVEAEGLGLEEAASAITVVEWAGPLLHLLPQDRLCVSIEQGGAEDARHLNVAATGDRAQELLTAWMVALQGESGVVSGE